MITEKDLLEAIAECQGQRNPNANTCAKLASYYIILDHMEKMQEDKIPKYSYSTPPNSDTVNYFGSSEFSKAIHGMNSESAWMLMDELMDTLLVINPRLYNGVMRKIKGGH